MAGHHYETVENNVTGKPVNGATVLVYEDGATKVGDAITSGTLATIYSDDGITLIDQAANPILTDNRGFYEFWTNESVVALAFLYEGAAKRAIIDVEVVGGTVSSDVTALAARVDKHDTVLGLAANATNLGTFTGSTITDNDDVKGALQSLETAADAAALTLDGLGTMAVENTTSYYTQSQVNTLISGFGGSGIYESAPTKPVAANFTLENAGTASIANGNYGVTLTMPSSTVNVRFARLTVGLPGSSWTAIGRSSMITPYATNTIHHGCLMVRNSTSGRVMLFGANNSHMNVSRWTDYTTFSAAQLDAAANFGREMFWKKITCDGTTLRFYSSSNGVDWGEVYNEALATFIAATGSLDQIGFGSANGAASSVTNIDLFESFTVA